MNFPDLSALREALGPFWFLLDAGFWIRLYSRIRITLIFLGPIFLAASVWTFIQTFPLRKKLYVLEGRRAYKAPQKQNNFEEETRLRTRRRWDDIVKKAKTAGSPGYSMAVIEADILLEETMGRLGFLGKNLAERLRTSAPGELPSINDIWEAHKLRNRIAHESSFRPSYEETMKSLSAYRKALEELRTI
ncbi:MAG: hypothetical protein A2931_02510 [Candidatus Niyogibacteria bacterium RIFCSPLOWO2_01_FULL_45_48]|uniref:DUF4145 domain-containing protein n=1 Tax=Candidatus Niyogibacteria bacterium RIFCSPLOWO2_01_FULL_45_48 TaxID=1801724 RepID=A0A1G2EYT0_9BACT|nr:MAG: hypothetical protein A2931_02510 [Candidatus Niyogibacteria bacterium RIFCSPLOWO2_01_FULL_45_48]OGZ31104.1 MAG: hypothetical protein A2835_02085 [Candidatus Niyogibacteria bacterium RIFCSPHIGHO2_01_FULL_45_28]